VVPSWVCTQCATLDGRRTAQGTWKGSSLGWGRTCSGWTCRRCRFVLLNAVCELADEMAALRAEVEALRHGRGAEEAPAA
jgi:hypothetical protein